MFRHHTILSKQSLFAVATPPFGLSLNQKAPPHDRKREKNKMCIYVGYLEGKWTQIFKHYFRSLFVHLLCAVSERYVAEMHTKNVRVKSNRTANLTLETQLTTNYSPANHYQLNVQKNDMDTKLQKQKVMNGKWGRGTRDGKNRNVIITARAHTRNQRGPIPKQKL